MKIFIINVFSILGYLVVALFSPVLWYQGKSLKIKVPRLPTPSDRPYGFFHGVGKSFKILGLGESALAGVGIGKHALTLTGLTAAKLNKLLGYNVNWEILAESGISLKRLNKLIIHKSDEKFDLVLVSMGGNDVFQLTPPWLWKKNIEICVRLFFKNEKKPLILFSPVPPVGKFPAIRGPLRIVFGLWENLLQACLAQAINSMDNVHLLDVRFPDCKKYYLEDGIHPSSLAYGPWSEKLAIMTVELLKQKKIGN